MFGLLLIGGYTAYTTLDIMNRKAKWDNIVKDYNLERDYATILKICGDMSIEDLKNAYDTDIRDAIYNCKKNLKTIPYLTKEDISEFEEKIYSIKAADYTEKRKKSYEYGKNEMVKLRKEYKDVPRVRTTYNRHIGSFSHDSKENLYYLMKDTFFGELVYNPPYREWMEREVPKDGELLSIKDKEHIQGYIDYIEKNVKNQHKKETIIENIHLLFDQVNSLDLVSFNDISMEILHCNEELPYGLKHTILRVRNRVEKHEKSNNQRDILKYDAIWKSAPDPCGYTDKYQVWVVDTPNKVLTGSFFNASMAYVKGSVMSNKEEDYRRKGGLPLKIDEENNKNIESSSDSNLVESTDGDTDDKLKNIQNKFIELKNQGIKIEFEYDNNENLSFTYYGDKHFVFKYSDIAKALEFISDLGSCQDFSKIYNKYQSFVILKL